MTLLARFPLRAPPREAEDARRLKAWLRDLIEWAINWLDELEAHETDREDDEREVYLVEDIQTAA